MLPEIGSMFGELTCIDHVYGSKIQCIWRCSCGNKVQRSYKSVVKGKHQHCGCKKVVKPKPIPLNSGDRHNHLTAIKEVRRKHEYSTRWLWRCDCGNEKEIDKGLVLNGNTTSCGCGLGRNNVPVDLTGKRFGKWLVLRLSENRGKSRTDKRKWGCLCTMCGTEHDVSQTSLQKGTSRSCKKCSYQLRGPYKGPSDKALSVLWHNYKGNARTRGIPFNLTREQLTDLVKQPCAYCGSTGDTRQHHLYNGIDRVDNSKGYEPDNCVPCCRACNKAKSTMTLEQFKEHVRAIYKHLDL